MEKEVKKHTFLTPDGAEVKYTLLEVDDLANNPNTRELGLYYLSQWFDLKGRPHRDREDKDMSKRFNSLVEKGLIDKHGNILPTKKSKK
ncbi:MAG: hypothetical protein FWE53_02420 [Firmicutes bacterium]|nr:hypothetical protein [Bacillota bacterium]